MVSILNIFTIINLTLLGALLYFQKNSSITNKLLGLIVFIPATPFLINYLLYTGVLYRFPSLMFLCCNFLWAPLVYIYVQLLLGKDVRFNAKKKLIHTIPYLLYVFCLFLLYIQDDTYRQSFLERVFNGNFPWQLAIVNIVLLVQSLFYIVISYINLKCYIKKITLKIENGTSIVKVKWLNFFLIILLALPFLAMIACVFFPMRDAVYIYSPLIYDIAFYTVIYGAIRYSTIFSTSEFQHYIHAEKEIREKYATSNLQSDEADEFYHKILTYMESEKPYLDSELSLKQLSANINISQHQLSQVINQKFKKTFFDLINFYRIEEAKIKIKAIELSKLTIEGIGIECGFGSPTTFYRAFKKNTGLTPSQYIKQK